MAHANFPLCENRKNILPACERVSSKLDSLTTIASTQCLPGEKVSFIKQTLLPEVNNLKTLIQLGQEYLLSVKDDLFFIKVGILAYLLF